jgi:hypothetical protein
MNSIQIKSTINALSDFERDPYEGVVLRVNNYIHGVCKWAKYSEFFEENIYHFAFMVTICESDLFCINDFYPHMLNYGIIPVAI